MTPVKLSRIEWIIGTGKELGVFIKDTEGRLSLVPLFPPLEKGDKMDLSEKVLL